MTIATLFYSLVFASLVAVAAAALDGLLRLGGRATRGIWAAALCVTVVGTAAAPLRVNGPPVQDVLQLGLAPSRVAPAPPSLLERIAQPFVMVRRAAAGAADRTLAQLPIARSPRLDRWLDASWVAATFLLLALLAAVHAHFGRARRAWPRATLDGTDVRLAPHTGPAVIGVLTPEIVVPAWLVERAAAERRLVLDHEREHLRARDPLVLAAAYCAAALVPWHPAVWWMLSRLRLAVELDCDARVLRRGVAPRRYGALLIDLAARHPEQLAGVPVLGLTLTDLERRLIAMTPHPRSFTYVRRGALAVTALVAFAIACDAPVPTSASAPRTVDAARTPLASAIVLPDDSVQYRIDGMLPDDSIAFRVVPDVRKRVEFLVASTAAQEFKVTAAPGTRMARDDVDAAQALREKDFVDEQMAAPRPDRMKMRVTFDPAQAVREKALVAATATAHQAAQSKVNLSFNGLVVIDGAPASNAALEQLPPQRIASIDVLKGVDATSKYSDPRAANGVIQVTTKHP
jgi:hypothetical protein